MVAEAESAFFKSVHQFNSLLKINAEAAMGVDFIRLKGLTHAWKEHLQQDGVHLTGQALKIHARNLRSGAILALHRARGDSRGVLLRGLRRC